MKKSKSIKASRAVDAAITYVILIAVAVFFFFPCLWLILASFSDSGSLYTLKGFFPEAFSFRNYQNLFTDTQMYGLPVLLTFAVIRSSSVMYPIPVTLVFSIFPNLCGRF